MPATRSSGSYKYSFVIQCSSSSEAKAVFSRILLIMPRSKYVYSRSILSVVSPFKTALTAEICKLSLYSICSSEITHSLYLHPAL